MIYTDTGDKDNLDGLERVVRATAKALREHLDEFDVIAVRGNSGVIVGAPVSLRIKKPLVVIRKPSDKAHSRRHINVKRLQYARALFLDDFVSSGETRDKVKEAVEEAGGRLVAQYTYEGYRAGFEPLSFVPPATNFPMPAQARSIVQDNPFAEMYRATATLLGPPIIQRPLPENDVPF